MKQAIFLISVASVGGAGAGDGVRDSGVTTHIPSGGDTQFDHLHTILHICLRRVVQNYTLFSYDLTILGIGNHFGMVTDSQSAEAIRKKGLF